MPPARQRRSDIVQRDGTIVRRLHFYFPLPLARALAVHCAANDTDMTEFVVAAVRRAITPPPR